MSVFGYVPVTTMALVARRGISDVLDLELKRCELCKEGTKVRVSCGPNFVP